MRVKRLDHLVISELFGPWAFGVAMFSVLIVAATFLGRISEYISQGVPAGSVVQFLFLALPGVLAKTFPMATLLASLLAFGRLSADSEVTAIRASGASIYRIMAPVSAFCALIAIVAFAINEVIVPPATVRFLALQSEVARTLDVKSNQPQAYPMMDKGKLTAYLMIEDLDLAAKTAHGAVIAKFDDHGNPEGFMMAKQLVFTGDSVLSVKDDIQQTGGGWMLRGGARYISADGMHQWQTDGDVWPSAIPRPMASPAEMVATKTTDGDPYNFAQLVHEIALAATDPTVSPKRLANMQFWLWNKIALPFTAVVFGLLGAPLGIRNARGGAATGFAMAVAIIFCYFVIVNTLNVFAQANRMPAFVASFTPLVIGLVCAVAIMRQREN